MRQDNEPILASKFAGILIGCTKKQKNISLEKVINVFINDISNSSYIISTSCFAGFSGMSLMWEPLGWEIENNTQI